MIGRAKMHLSLNQIAGANLASSEFGSGLVKRVTEACHVPIGGLTAAQIGLLIRQDIERSLLVPMAIEILEDNPLIETEFYPGDLLRTLLELPQEYWSENQQSWLALNSVLTQLDETIAMLGDARDSFASFLT